jgi:hypothetical protein
MAKKKSQPQSALPFFIMAVFAFMAGFPIWLAFVLVLIGLVVLKIEKDKKALNKLPPLPPAQAEGSSNTASPFKFPLPVPEPFGEQTPDAGSLDPVPPSQPQPRQQSQPQPQSFEPVIYQEPEPTQAPEPLPWMTPSPETHGAAHRAAIGKQPAVLSATQIRTNNIYSSGLKPRQPSRFATSLRGRDSARQAIVAMTVLGQPRALQPYEFDPIEQTDVAPGRPSK